VIAIVHVGDVTDRQTDTTDASDFKTNLMLCYGNWTDNKKEHLPTNFDRHISVALHTRTLTIRCTV